MRFLIVGLILIASDVAVAQTAVEPDESEARGNAMVATFQQEILNLSGKLAQCQGELAVQIAKSRRPAPAVQPEKPK